MGIVMLDNKVLMSGNQMALYIPPPMPVKGDIVNLDLDGSGNKQYRVLKMNGNVAQVIAMYDTLTSVYNSTSTTTTFGSTTAQKYESSTLDTYLNTTWYNTLTSVAKAAIVPENVVQHCYQYYDEPNTPNTPTYTYQYQYNWSDSDYENANDIGNVTVGNRNIFALDLKDIFDYFGKVCITSDELMTLFWNSTTKVSKYLWLRSSCANDSDRAWSVGGNDGNLANDYVDTSNVIRPALNLDLSKISFTLAGGESMTETETWTLNEATTLPPSTVINFSYKGADYTQIISGEEEDTALGLTVPYATFVAVSGNNLTFTGDAGDTGLTWSSNTVLIFSESPTSNLLTWLQSNATKQ